MVNEVDVLRVRVRVEFGEGLGLPEMLVRAFSVGIKYAT